MFVFEKILVFIQLPPVSQEVVTTKHKVLDLSLLIYVILPNEGMLIVCMLHSYWQDKGDIKETRVNTGVKYECLKVKRTKRLV